MKTLVSMFAIALSFLLIARVQLSDAFAMAPVTRGNMCRLVSSSRTILFDTSMEKERRMGELTKPEQKVFDIMEAIHDSKYLFRVVVVGKGAILETTTELGPVMKVTQSPSTGANLMTFASKDQSTEFHLQLSNVYKIVIAEKETPAKVLRIVRLLNEKGEAMCSLILKEESNDAVVWYDSLVAEHGQEIQL